MKAFEGSTVQLNYSLQCQSEDSVLLFVDNILVKEYKCSASTCNAPFAIDSFSLLDYEVDDIVQNTIYRQLHPYAPPKNRTFTAQWSYVKRSDATNTSCDRIMFSVSIYSTTWILIMLPEYPSYGWLWIKGALLLVKYVLMEHTPRPKKPSVVFVISEKAAIPKKRNALRVL